MRRLAIITTHPIQYYAPVFQLLRERHKIEIKVFYTWGETALQKYDPGFGQQVNWDIPLLEGYDYEFVQNTATDPGSHHARGIINPTLIEKVTDWQADAILVYGWYYKSHLLALKYFKNKLPVFFRGDSTLLDEKPGLRNVLRFFYLRWVYRHVDYAFYPGVNTKNYFKKYGLTEHQLLFAPHAIDNDRFAKPKNEKAQALRADLQIKGTDILILYAGKFEEKKDPILLIEAFIKLSRPYCHLLLTGSGMLAQTLKAKAANNANIHFLSFQNQQQMPIVYQACDLFCMPSKGPNETWGLVVNEAMACSKAVLTSDKVGCAIDLVKPGYNGDIFKSGNFNSLLNSLTKLTASKAILQQLGLNSGIMIKDWSFSNFARAIEDKLTS